MFHHNLQYPKATSVRKGLQSMRVSLSIKRIPNGRHKLLTSDIDGKIECIGHNENEEEAAVDYARAVFKYYK
eukprot:scaffold10115_cov95-Skeletonema_dohrnii-CCMP3373.AAC.3